jgi:hypothetical protein
MLSELRRTARSGAQRGCHLTSHERCLLLAKGGDCWLPALADQHEHPAQGCFMTKSARRAAKRLPRTVPNQQVPIRGRVDSAMPVRNNAGFREWKFLAPHLQLAAGARFPPYRCHSIVSSRRLALDKPRKARCRPRALRPAERARLRIRDRRRARVGADLSTAARAGEPQVRATR